MPVSEKYSTWTRDWLGGTNVADHPSALDPREMAEGTRNVVVSNRGSAEKRLGTSSYNALITNGGPILGMTRAYGLLNAGGTAHTIAGLDVSGHGELRVKIGAGAFGDARSQDDAGPTQFTAGLRWRFFQYQNLAVCMNGQSGILPQVWDGTNWFDLGISASTLKAAMASTAVATVASTASLPLGLYKFVFVDRVETGAKAGGRSGPMPSVVSHRFDIEITTAADKIQFTNAPIPASAANVYELYAAGPDDAVFYRIHEFKNGDSTTWDWLGQEFDVGEGLGPPLNGVFDWPPPAGALFGVVADGRVFLADEDAVYWSTLGNPHNFDPDSRIDIPGGRTITGLFAVAERLFVLCDSGVFRIRPAPPGYYIYQVADGIGCVAPDTIAQCAEYLVFLGHDGVHAISISGSDALAGTETPGVLVSEQIGPWIQDAVAKDEAAAVGNGYEYYLSIRDPGKSSNNRTLLADFSRPQVINGEPRLARWTSFEADVSDNEYGWGFNSFHVFMAAADGGTIYGGSSTHPKILKLLDSAKPNADYIPDESGETAIPMTVKTARMTLADLFEELRLHTLICQWLGTADADVSVLAEWGEREQRYSRTFEATGGTSTSRLPFVLPAILSYTAKLDLRLVSLPQNMLGRTFQIVVDDRGTDSRLQLVGLGLRWSATGREVQYA